ncbi:kinase subunit of RNA polymerase II carboxy-terminal domain kinase I [Vanrija albida]|uniref:Kinase subunit of RNA polymerase II carboxy-terminal domain kinase I n=1 Tax=Vanrija albida TaxID=181172 RepID=A0ABR3Q5G3_9TREE
MSSYRSDSRNSAGGSGGTHPGVKRESTWRPGASSSSAGGAHRSTGAGLSSSSASRPTNAWATRDSPRVQSPGPSSTRVDSYYEPPETSSSSNRWGNADDRDRNGHRGSSRDRDRSRDGDRRRDDGWASRTKQQDKDTRGSWDDYRQRRAALSKRASSPDRSAYRRRDDDASGDRGARWSKADDRDRGWDRRREARASSPDNRERERSRRRSPSPAKVASPRGARRPSPDYGNRSESESDTERGRRASRPSPRWRSPTPEPKRRAPSSPRAPEAKRAREHSPPSWRRRSSSPPAPRGRSSSRSPTPPKRQASVDRERSPSPARGYAARSAPTDRDRAARSPSPSRTANRWPDRERWRPPARSQHNSAPARDRELPVRDRDLPARDRDFPARDRDAPARDREVPVRDRDLPVRDRDLPVRDRDLPARDPPRGPRAQRDWDEPKRSFDNRRFGQENDAPVKMRQWGRGRSPSQSRSPSPAPAARRSQSPPRRQQGSQSTRSRSPSPRAIRRRPSPSPTPPAQRVLSPPTGPRADRVGGADNRRGGGWRRVDAGSSTDRRDVGFPDRHSEPANRTGTNGHPAGRPSTSSFPRARNASPTKGGWKSISARTALARNATPESGHSNGAAALQRSHEDTEVDIGVNDEPRKPAPQRSDKWSPIKPRAGELLHSGEYLSAMENKERQYDRHLRTIAPYIKAAFSQWYEQGTSPALKDFLVHYFGRSPSNDELDQVQQLLTLRKQLSQDQEELRHLHAQALRTEGQGQPPTGPAALHSLPSSGTDTQVATRTPDATTPSTSGVASSLGFTLGRNTKVVPGEAYERLAQVGEGTYGKVYKARSNADGALVALKRIRMEQEKDGFPITSMREIKLLQALNHPNVVCLREMMVSKGSVYMVLEYMNHDLTGILSHPEVTLSPANIKSLNYQMLSGLGYLHRRGILHRDMKGSNILLNGAGELKLADFGLARFYHKAKRDDYTNRVITLWYRSPELLLGETCYGPEVDTWSAGCIMLEIFTTKPVFQGTDEINQLDVIWSIMGTPEEAQWPAISELPWYELMRPREAQPSRFRAAFGKWLTPDALDLVEGLLAFDPTKRLLADAALRKPYFTTEAPAMEPPTQLAGCGEHHEMSVKLERHRRREGK